MQEFVSFFSMQLCRANTLECFFAKEMSVEKIHVPVFYWCEPLGVCFRTATPGSLLHDSVIAQPHDECAICVTNGKKKTVVLQCKHEFHRDCLVDYVSQAPTRERKPRHTCPTCDRKIVESTCACGCQKTMVE